MVRFFKTSLLLLIVIAGVWLLLNKDRIQQPQDVIRLAREELVSMQSSTGVGVPAYQIPYSQSVQPNSYPERPPVQQRPETHQRPHQQRAPVIQAAHRQARTSIRVASMMIDPIDGNMYESANLILADICRRYDVIALQGTRSTGSNSAISLVKQMNSIEANQSTGARPNYRLLIEKAQPGVGSPSTQLAIIFDEAAVSLDDNRWYQVRDPDDILVHKPMVAWFRARGVPSDQALTFSLANVQLDPHRPDRELRYISELFRAVRDDGRGEDDVIIAGNFNSGDRGLDPIQQQSGLTWVISGMPTNTSRTAQFDNVVFNPAATVEFTQRGGVFDFMKHYNLRLADAQRISTHMPVWAEFNLQEGNASPIVASKSQQDRF